MEGRHTVTSEGTSPPARDGDDEAAGWDDEHPAFDTSRAHQARIYDYLLGGKDNFAVDREAAEKAIAAYPEIVYGTRANRAFLGRAVRHLVSEGGIRQFLDIGTGIPSAGSVHEVAQEEAPDSRVVYVDYDPVVLAHARALLTGTAEGATDYIHADLRDTATILERAARTLDFSRPVAVIMLAILHVITDDDDPQGIVARIMSDLPPGSYLAISHVASDIEPDKVTEMTGRINTMSYQQLLTRSRDEVMRFFGGLELVEPGLVQVQQWRPDTEPAHATPSWAGVGRKPG